METIKVLSEVERTVNISSLNVEETDSLRNELMGKTVSLSSAQAFIDMAVKNAETIALADKPQAPELLIRRIILLSRNSCNSVNNFVYPMTTKFTGKFGGAMHHKRYLQHMSELGAQKLSKTTEEHLKLTTGDKAITVSFDDYTLSRNTTMMSYIESPHSPVSIVGLFVVVNSVAIAQMCAKKYPADILRSGSFDFHDCADATVKLFEGRVNMLDKSYYARSIKSLAGEQDKRTPAGEIFIDFLSMDEKNVMAVLEEVFAYMQHIKYLETYIARYVCNYIHAATRDPQHHIFGQQAYGSTPPQITLPQTCKDEMGLQILKSVATIQPTCTGDDAYDKFVMFANADRENISGIFAQAMLGVNKGSLQDDVDAIKVKKSYDRFIETVKLKRAKDIALTQIFEAIYLKKFSAERLKKVRTIINNSYTHVTPEIFLKTITPAEAKVVTAEHSRMTNHLEAVLKNKCAHVAAVKKLRRTPMMDEKLRQLENVKDFIDQQQYSKDDLIKCKVCKFDLICPHVIDMLTNNSLRYMELKNVMDRYIDRTPNNRDSYCKICGELILREETYFDQTGENNDIDEELNTFIWSEVASNTKYIRATAVINMNHFITACTNSIYPYIKMIEKQLERSKTNSAEEIKSKKKLFTAIYSFACFAHFILNGSTITLASASDTAKPAKNNIVEVFRTFISNIMQSKNIAIREIQGMNAEVIKIKLLEAFKSLKNVEDVESISANRVDSIVRDPSFNYLFEVDAIFSNKPAKKDRDELISGMERILGHTEKEVESWQDRDGSHKSAKKQAKISLVPDNIYKTIRIAQSSDAKKYIAAFEKIKPEWGDANIAAESQGAFIAAADLYTQVLSMGLGNESMYISVGVSNRDDPNSVIVVDFSAKYKEVAKLFAEYDTHAKILQDNKKKIYSRVYTIFGNHKIRPSVVSNLGRVYDEDGAFHVFDISVVERDGKQVDVTASEFAEAANKGAPIPISSIVDKRCRICGVLKSQTHTLNDARIKESINIKMNIVNFFRFYENRCLKGVLHTASQDGKKCTKCDIVFDWINAQPPEAYNFFRANQQKYNEDKFADTVRIPVSVVAPTVYEMPEFEFDFSIVLEFAKRLKVNHKLIATLGATSGVDKAMILSGEFIAPEVESFQSPRIYILHTYVCNLIADFNRMRFYSRTNQPSRDIVDLFNISKMDKFKSANIGESIPDIVTGYLDKFAAVKATKTPQDVSNFCLQSLCEKCIKLMDVRASDIVDETIKTLCENFVKMFMRKTLRSEELLMKFGMFNRSIIYGDGSLVDKSAGLDGDGTVAKKTDLGDDDEEEEGAFSMDAFDLEEDPDAIPDEDLSNTIRIEGE